MVSNAQWAFAYFELGSRFENGFVLILQKPVFNFFSQYIFVVFIHSHLFFFVLSFCVCLPSFWVFFFVFRNVLLSLAWFAYSYGLVSFFYYCCVIYITVSHIKPSVADTAVFFFGYIKMCKFISALIYSTLCLYMSCWWLLIQKKKEKNSGVRLVQAWTNARRENNFRVCRYTLIFSLSLSNSFI